MAGELRVALILSELRPGGMEKVVVHLANGLSSRRIPIAVVCLGKGGELSHEIEGRSVRLEVLNSERGMDVWALFKLARVLRGFKPTIINIHDYASSPYAVIASLLSGRIPLLFTAHGLLYEGFEGLRRRNRFFSKAFSGVTAVSEAVAKRHRDYLQWKGDIHIIRNGVPAIKRDNLLGKAVRNELGIRDSEFLFLSIGNPRPEKGFEDLIDAVALLKESAFATGGFKVAVAGRLIESEYCKMLLARISEKNLSNWCRFLGFRRDTEALYSAADVFVLSSRSEGLPMVVLEAMMAGVPVIATSVGGVPDAVRDNGLLVPPADPNALAAAMNRLLKERDLACRLGNAGKMHAMSTYSVDRMVEEYIACYRDIVSIQSGEKSKSKGAQGA